jgi:hypothetical protein
MVAWKMCSVKLPLCVNVEALRRNRNLLGEERMGDNGLTNLVSTGEYLPWNLGRCVRKEWESGIEEGHEYTNHPRGPLTSRPTRSTVLVDIH